LRWAASAPAPVSAVAVACPAASYHPSVVLVKAVLLEELLPSFLSNTPAAACSHGTVSVKRGCTRGHPPQSWEGACMQRKEERERETERERRQRWRERDRERER